MDSGGNNIYEQVYNVRENEDLMPKVAQCLCVLMPRGLMAIGFSAAKELLMIHYTGYGASRPTWSLDFFEHMFIQEPLFATREKVRGIFILSERNLVVPQEIYDEKEARKWLRAVHFIENKDVIEVAALDDDKAMYLYVAATGIAELVKINFRRALIYPVPLYHFRNTRKQSLYLQCSITPNEVCATLHNYSQLLWHQVFDYSCAEDIAYTIKHLCMENNISPAKIAFRCDAVTGGEYEILTNLMQYFPGIRCGKGPITGRWDAAVSLAQLMLECVL